MTARFTSSVEKSEPVGRKPKGNRLIRNDFEICCRSTYIVRLDIASKKWHKMGLLKQARFGHGMIHHAGSFVVIGGDDISMATEVCNFKVKFSFLIVRK